MAGIVDIEIMSLEEAGLEGEIPETADTLEGNAQQKAEWVLHKMLDLGCESAKPLSSIDGVFADDTGLEVEALGGAPGVYSARYAAMSGERDLCGGANVAHSCSFDDNIDKLLRALEGKTNRKACFRTVICLLDINLSTHFFEGRVDGQILTERHTNGEGFGYDPVFMPDRFAVSFAEMPLDVKNQISHRGLAVQKLVEYLMALS